MKQPQTEELVVLVDEENNEIGTAPKSTVHGKDTPLHRGFSCFLFNSKGELLLTKRSKEKRTFPGVWTNTVCGHPAPGESTVEAAKRRLKDELGVVVDNIKEVAPYRYQFIDKNGIAENEICPIIVAYSDVDPEPNLQEIEEWKWIDWGKFFEDLKNNPQKYSPWCKEEASIIKALPV